MKKKSASRSAFFNLRVLIGLCIVLAGVFLALAGLGTFSALAQAQQKHKIITDSKDPLVPNGFDCSKIHELGIDKQENLRAGAIMIACGQAQGGSASHGGIVAQVIQKLPLPSAIKKLLAPLAYGAADVDLVNHPETFPNVTQSETFSWANPDNPQQVVVAYNDSRGRNFSPINISAASVSTDGGTTFDRLTRANGQGTFDNTFGDPVVFYNRPTSTWFTVWIDGGCGGGGLGGYKSTDPSNPNSWTHFCVHSGGGDDRESGWLDENPASPFANRMYVSWNDFAQSEQIRSTYSSDNGITWSAPVNVTTSFIRNVQITGDKVTGDVYIAGMDEGGGGSPHNDINKIYRSTDGGNTWTNTYTGPSFPGPGVGAVGYFACMFTGGGAGFFWRHEGWGEPAAFNSVVSLVYDQHGSGADAGDVYYIRSTDKGVTFGAPLKLNTDSTTRPQWQPNISVSDAGTLFAVWYDARESASCTYGSPGVPCYRMFSRKSKDNGVTWLADDMFSDVVSPLPAQPDPNIQTPYAGDYDYGSAILVKHLSSWVDGRVTISGTSQQDAFTDRELVGFAVTTTDPACGSVVFTQPTDFIINLSDPVDTSTVQPTDFTVNGIAANSDSFSNGDRTITFHFNSSPVTTPGLQTMHIPAGAFNRASDNEPNFEFNCTFCYAVAPLTVTSTNPPVGGTFTGPGTQTYDVNFNQALDPTSVQDSDLMLSGVTATVTGHTLMNGNMTVEFTINFTSIFSGTLTAEIAAGAVTAGTCNPNTAFSGNYQYTGNVCDTGLIQNEGFETGTFPPWIIDGHTNDPVVATNFVHSGTFSAFAGGNPQQNTYCEENNNEPLGDSSFYQQFTVPAGSSTLSFWHMDCTNDSITFDWQDAYITDSNGNILQTIFHVCDTSDWTNEVVDMTSYAGQTVWIKFLVHQDGFNPPGDTTGMWVDDVVLYQPCGTASPTPTATATPTPTATPGPRPIPTPRPRPTPPPRP